MPFGLTNVPATEQALMNNTLCKYLDKFVLAYMDNILVFTTRTLDQHKEHVQKVLTKLQEQELKLNLKKCKFY